MLHEFCMVCAIPPRCLVPNLLPPEPPGLEDPPGSPSLLFLQDLMAYSFLSFRLKASFTCPNVPVPRCLITT